MRAFNFILDSYIITIYANSFAEAKAEYRRRLGLED